MANLITVGRLILLFFVIALIYHGGSTVVAVAMVLVALVFAGDGLDGYVARRRGSTSPFGAVFDIAGDRVVEQVLWIVFAHLNLVGVWVPLVVVTRGSIVDALRSLSYSDGMTAFGDRNMMRSALTRWLTAGRFMRALFGYSKAIGFVFLTGYVQFGRDRSTAGGALGSLYGTDWFHLAGWMIVWSALALTIIRGIPVIVDALSSYHLAPGARARPGRPVSSRPTPDQRGRT